MARQQVGQFAVAFIYTPAQRIDKKQMRRAARRLVKRHRRIANFFQRLRQTSWISRVLSGARIR